MLAEDPRWGIVGVSLQSPDVRDRLQPQGGLYSVLERNVAGTRAAVVGSIGRALFLGEDFGEVARAFADPRTKIVSLTVTEKGYCHDPASRRLAADHPGLARDYADPTRPRTTIGVLVAGLGIRRLADTGPITVLSCDNLPENGRLLAELVREYAGRVEPKLVRWLQENVAFPSTMVDRRVPATTAADLADAEASLGMHDAAAIACEPFSQWVIEDRFAAGRPPWERAGAELVRDVVPYEAMKLRMLNATHSGLAYLGFLAGLEHTCDVVAVPAFRAFARRLMREDAAPTLTPAPGVDAARYETALLERFANPALKHRCDQIAIDGSQKLPQRLLDTARARLAAGAACHHVALAVAAWMRYVRGVDEAGGRFEVRDPLAARLAAIWRDQGPDARALARACLGVREVFGDDLPRAPAFVDTVERALASLCEQGARATVESRYGAGGEGAAALVLKPGREKSLLRRHPWVFSGAVERVDAGAQAGDTVAVRTRPAALSWRGPPTARSRRSARGCGAGTSATRIDDGILRRARRAAIARRARPRRRVERRPPGARRSGRLPGRRLRPLRRGRGLPVLVGRRRALARGRSSTRCSRRAAAASPTSAPTSTCARSRASRRARGRSAASCRRRRSGSSSTACGTASTSRTARRPASTSTSARTATASARSPAAATSSTASATPAASR